MALFDREEPRLGLLIETWKALLSHSIVCFKEGKIWIEDICSDMNKISCSDSFESTTQIYLNKILKGVKLLNLHGELIEPDNARFLSGQLFALNLQEYPQQSIREFLESTVRYLCSLSIISKQGSVCEILIRSMDVLKRKIGFLQRSITPYTFGCKRHNCLFCYTQKELGMIIYSSFWIRPLSEIDSYISHYNPETREGLPRPTFAMQDWEPFEHPDLLKIIQNVSKIVPSEPFYIVTHGGLLTEELVIELAKFPNIHLQIS